MCQTDTLLAGRLKKGDAEAARAIVDKYHKPIYQFMIRLGHSAEISDELAQQTFILAWKSIRQLSCNSSLRAWLYRIAVNVSKTYRRRQRRRSEVSLSEADLSDIGTGCIDKLEAEDELAELRRAIGRLSRKLKETIVLHYLEQLSISEAASAAGVRTGTFKSRLNLALKCLREELTEKPGDL